NGITFKAAGNINSIGTISGTDVNIESTAATNGSVTFGADVTASTKLTVTAKGNGGIQQTNVNILLDTPEIALTSGSGDIGSSSTYLTTNASRVSASTLGDIYLLNKNAGDVHLLTISGKNIGLNFVGSVITDGALTAGSNLSLTVGNSLVANQPI